RNLLYKTGKGAAALFWHSGAWMAREAVHVHLVHNCARRWPLQGSVAFPIIRLHVYDHALHRCRGIVASLPRGVPTVAVRNSPAASVRIEKDFGWIETHCTRRIENSLNPITVGLPCFYIRYKGVPVVIGPVSCRIDRNHTCRPGIVDTIEKKEFDFRRVF